MEIIKAHKQWLTNASKAHKEKEEYKQALYYYTHYENRIMNAFDFNHEEEFISEIVSAFNEYKDEVDQLKYRQAFNNQTKFHSTIHEEFWVYISEYLFKHSNLFNTENIYIGYGHSLQGIQFSPNSLQDIINFDPEKFIKPTFKDRDFMIALKVNLNLLLNNKNVHIQSVKKNDYVYFPIVTIECKQYIDKTMLDNAFNAANNLKKFSPFTFEAISIELNKLGDVNIAGSGLDAFFILRKQKISEALFKKLEGPTNTVDINKRKPIDKEVVFLAYQAIKNHIEKKFWNATEKNFLEEGILLN